MGGRGRSDCGNETKEWGEPEEISNGNLFRMIVPAGGNGEGFADRMSVSF